MKSKRSVDVIYKKPRRISDSYNAKIVEHLNPTTQHSKPRNKVCKSSGKANQNHNPTAVRSFAKLGVPRPVTGSHPVPAVKPLVLQPGFVPEINGCI